MSFNKKTFFISVLFFMVTAINQADAERSCYKFSFDHLFPTEAQYCASCATNTNPNQDLFKLSLLVPTTACFKKSISSITYDRYTICQNEKPVRARHPPCSTDEYIHSTSSIFHEVSQCLNINPSYFFALLNRESRFQLTARSKTGASCYGQLTGIAIKDVNIWHLNYLNGIKKSCASIKEHFTPLKTRVGLNSNNRRVILKTSDTICKLHSNPYICMAYAGIYFKYLLDSNKKILDKLDIIQAQKRDGSFDYFKTQKSYNNYSKKFKPNESPYIGTKVISLFRNKEEMAKLLAMYTYNGGPSVSNLFRTYVNKIKGKAWSANEDTRNTYSDQIFGQHPIGISSSDFMKTFSQYIKNENPRAYTEASQFPKNIFKDYKSVTQSLNPSCGNIDTEKFLKTDNNFTAPSII